MLSEAAKRVARMQDAVKMECLNKIEPDWRRQVSPLLILIWYTQLKEQERRYE